MFAELHKKRNKKECESDIENKLMVTKGGRAGEG